MIILSNEEIESFLSIKTCIDALEKAYASWDKGTAINRPRTDLVMPSATEAGRLCFQIDGSRTCTIHRSSPCASTPTSSVGPSRATGRSKPKFRAAPGDKYVGLVMLFSTVTGEPLAMFPDGVVQRMRVASSSALAARYLAREDASTMALFGSGWQAGSHVPAMCAVRPLKRINVYSPTKANREAFVKEIQPKVSAELRAVDSPEEAIRDADIIAATTNSLSRVVSADWVKPGLHLTCVRVPELGDDTIRKVDRLVIHAHQHAPANYVAGYGEEGIPPTTPSILSRKGRPMPMKSMSSIRSGCRAPDFKDLVTGKAQGRANAQESTCFLNNIGIGLQFAAVGAAVYSEAIAKGIGRELPTDWFLESVHP